jgi:hypothetical protein
MALLSWPRFESSSMLGEICATSTSAAAEILDLSRQGQVRYSSRSFLRSRVVKLTTEPQQPQSYLCPDLANHRLPLLTLNRLPLPIWFGVVGASSASSTNHQCDDNTNAGRREQLAVELPGTASRLLCVKRCDNLAVSVAPHLRRGEGSRRARFWRRQVARRHLPPPAPLQCRGPCRGCGVRGR